MANEELYSKDLQLINAVKTGDQTKFTLNAMTELDNAGIDPSRIVGSAPGPTPTEFANITNSGDNDFIIEGVSVESVTGISNPVPVPFSFPLQAGDTSQYFINPSFINLLDPTTKDPIAESDLTLTGDLVYDSEMNMVLVTGDGSIEYIKSV